MQPKDWKMSGIKGINMAISAAPAKGQDSPDEIKNAVQDFEALFINQMLKSMRDTVQKSDLFHGGSGEEIYSSMFDTELSKLMSKSGGIGLGDVLLEQFGVTGAQNAPDAGLKAEEKGRQAEDLKETGPDFFPFFGAGVHNK